MQHYQKYSYADDVRITEEVLDQIDLTPYIKKHTDVENMMAELEDEYDDFADQQNHDFFQGDLWNSYTVDEFSEYLKKKYNTRVYEEVITRYVIY